MCRRVHEEVMVDFSEEELDHLFVACGVQPPRGLEPEEVPPEARDALQGAVQRSLRARQMLTETEDGTWKPVPTVAQVVVMLARPQIAARASVSRAGQAETRRYGVLGPVGVEQRSLPPGVHRLTLFEAEDLLDQVLMFTGKPVGPRPEAPGFQLPAGDLRQILRLAASGDRPAVRYVLRAARVPRTSGNSFLNVLTPEIPVASFEITYLAPDGVFRGGELMWIDDAEHGLWTMPPLVEGPVTVDVSPASPAELLAELRSYFPAGLTAAPVG